MSDFGKNLKYYRKRKNLSQAALGELLGYGYTAVANYESGRNEPSFDHLITLASILDTTIDELLGFPLTTQESQLSSMFRKLSPENKQLLLSLAQALVQ